MARWQDVLALVANNVEEQFDILKDRFLGRLLCNRPLIIVPYRSYGREDKLYVRGRVLQNRGVTSARDNDSTWDNLLNMYRRLDSREVPHATLRLRYQDAVQEVVADEEGFFECWLSIPDHPAPGMGEAARSGIERGRPVDPARNGEEPPDRELEAEPQLEAATRGLWREVAVELLAPQCADGSPVTATCNVLVPPPSARFGVISDIDDTVIHTDVGHFLKMARTVFLGNARLRLPFEGVAAFYRALYEGMSEQEYNPLFYVSNSPWNMYDLFSDFFQMQDIPVGPVMILRDWGISRRQNDMAPLHARAFKTQTVRNIIDFYPDLPFILIGDSGEKDPEVYEEIAEHAPGRILAVYIRNVSRKPARVTAIRSLAEKVLAAGSTLILADNTLPLTEHALEKGWISPHAPPRVQEAKAADEAPPSPLEKLLNQPDNAPPTVVIGDETPPLAPGQATPNPD